MKRILLILIFGLGFFYTQAQTPITIDDTQTVQQLIDDILVIGNCAEVNNIVSPNNSTIGGDSFNSFAAFDGSASVPPFPFDSGIVLASNGVNMIPTGAPLQNGGFNWAGDPDLEALINQPGNTNNATVIEFDFIPFVDQISFNYFLASDEYPTFVCAYADTFAFILSGPGISNINDYDHDANPNTPDLTLDLGGLNIATLPGTNIPVNPTNVHDLSATCGPGALGEFAVPQLYDTIGEDDGTTMYFGRTLPLAATAQVIPGQTYNIKLAVADRGDTILNTAVFLESASFDLGGIDLGPDITIIGGNAPCEGDVVTLDAGFSAPNIQYFWAQNGTIIPGENGQTLDVTENGTYEVGIQIGSTGAACFGVSNQVVIEFYPEPEFAPSTPINLCQGDTLILDGEPINSSEYTSIDYTWFKDGVEVVGETASTLDITEGGQYEVIVDANACEDAITTFDVTLIDYQVTLPIPQESCIGQGESITLTAQFTGLTQDEIDNEVTYEWTTLSGTETTPTIEVTEAGTYTLTTTFKGCDETATETFTFFTNPMVSINGMAVICEGDTNTLDATPMNLNDLVNPTYSWTLDGNPSAGDSPVLDITQGGIYEITVDNNGCVETASIEVEFVGYTLDLSTEEGDTVLCTGGGGPDVLTLQADITGLTSAQENQITYLWSDNSTGETLTVSESGIYTLQTDVNGCIETSSIEIVIVETVQVSVQDAIKCPEDEVTLSPSYSSTPADATYTWTDQNGNQVATGQTFTTQDEGDYTVTVNNQGCVSTFTVNVGGYAVDNCVITQGISPNEDGFNDCMDLTWLNDQLGITKFTVFNRYGRKVFEENNYMDTFCGQDDNGNEIETGTYFYVIELENTDERFQETTIKGWVYVNVEQ